MPRIALSEVQAWLESAKLTIATLDSELLSQLEEEVLVQLGTQYNTSTWVTPETTPKIVRVIISKIYASFIIDRAYSENQDGGNDYAVRLMENANMLMNGIIGGSIDIPDNTPVHSSSSPSFFPTDYSSSQPSSSQNPEFGGPYFGLGKVF